MDQNENWEQRLAAARHLVSGSSLNGLVDLDDIIQVVRSDVQFEEEHLNTLMEACKLLLLVKTDLLATEIMYGLNVFDRQATLEAFLMAITIKEENWL